MHERLTGRVKFEKTNEGFGFIISDNIQYTKQDIHYSVKDIKEIGLTSLSKGQHVEFDMESGPKGPVAKSIVLQ
tara:strand:- start:1063 stop:1284 length:222 start_codon:yes stop_codon:yes gene_type:complete